jgi:RHS repeat-associated protein
VDGNFDGTDEIKYSYAYDGWNRFDSVYVNEGQLAKYTYDDALGLLTHTRLYNYQTPVCISTADDIDYSYDVRDRLTAGSSRFFDESLYYDGGSNRHPQLSDTSFSVMAGKNYNGNINAAKAVYKLSTASNYSTIGNLMDDPTYYGYTYDGMNRLTFGDASVMNVLTGTSASSIKRHYGDEGYKYDKAGNIRFLSRPYYYGPSVTSPANATDLWRYDYTTGTNKLNQVFNLNTSAVQRSYTYDFNGNMLSDDFKDVSATIYGRGNLPVSLTADGDGLQYLYDVKDTRIYKENDGADKEYYLQDANGKTVGIYNITGTDWSWYAYGKERIVKFGSGGTKEFFEYDHLGNTRVTFSTTLNCLTSASTFSINNAVDYYPYGKVLRSYNGSQTEKFLFTGKERDAETQLDYLGARFYDSDVARFLSLDPLQMKFADVSPYNYVMGNPILLIDPTGKAPDENKMTWNKEKKEYDKTKVNDKYGSNVQYNKFEGGSLDGQIQVTGKSGKSDWYDANTRGREITSNSIALVGGVLKLQLEWVGKFLRQVFPMY